MGPSGLCQILEMQEGQEKVGAEDPDLALPWVFMSAEPGGEGSLTVGMELNLERGALGTVQEQQRIFTQ